MKIEEQNIKFFREKTTIIFTLILLLFIFSFGFGIVLFGFLNSFNLFGAKLSYFISGQFTIYLSILLIFIYQKQVLKLEKKYENTY
ncbi:sodium/substrate symporter small subunit [Aliarcobacter cryaerophilus]|uniref:sodium/substrate symporter small subunit n=1 Tax=Aliarcobacter cryaerophilus TaxID=28198 RepID=UPI00112F0C00|nr:sodium/substrate symporter small subunit [Aliarcobacter cryaerophilus]